MTEYVRAVGRVLRDRLAEPRRFIQVLAGPRQSGKTTLVRQVLAGLDRPWHYASADAPGLEERLWLVNQWEGFRGRAYEHADGAVLVLDEVQKVPGWSEVVKRLWDGDTASRLPLQVVLLGSAPLLVRRGLDESLAGRFELLRVGHWSLAEMGAAFAWDLERYVLFGGYPGAAPLADDEDRWRAYVRDALIETTLARDVLLMSRVDKPALLRQLFRLACAYSAQTVSYTKLVGQLQDAGNTTTLAHYLELLAGAGLVTGLQKYAGSALRQRGSSPKLLALNTALVAAIDGRPAADLRADGPAWGRLVETAVGAHLVSAAAGTGVEVSWWRQGDAEVDYVLAGRGRVTAIEVKSGRRATPLAGLSAFAKQFDGARLLVVGGADGIPLEEFLRSSPVRWLA